MKLCTRHGIPDECDGGPQWCMVHTDAGRHDLLATILDNLRRSNWRHVSLSPADYDRLIGTREYRAVLDALPRDGGAIHRGEVPSGSILFEMNPDRFKGGPPEDKPVGAHVIYWTEPGSWQFCRYCSGTWPPGASPASLLCTAKREAETAAVAEQVFRLPAAVAEQESTAQGIVRQLRKPIPASGAPDDSPEAMNIRSERRNGATKLLMVAAVDYAKAEGSLTVARQKSDLINAALQLAKEWK